MAARGLLSREVEDVPRSLAVDVHLRDLRCDLRRRDAQRIAGFPQVLRRACFLIRRAVLAEREQQCFLLACQAVDAPDGGKLLPRLLRDAGRPALLHGGRDIRRRAQQERRMALKDEAVALGMLLCQRDFDSNEERRQRQAEALLIEHEQPVAIVERKTLPPLRRQREAARDAARQRRAAVEQEAELLAQREQAEIVRAVRQQVDEARTAVECAEVVARFADEELRCLPPLLLHVLLCRIGQIFRAWRR